MVRTVHHVDDFRSPSLIACQDRSIVAPDRVLCVSAPWIARLRDEFGVEAERVPNGVDAERFRPPRDAGERAAARDAAGLDGELAILTVGGIEPRKGSLTLLRRLRRRPRRRCPSAARCCSWPAARRCSTTATRSTASTRLRERLDLDGSVRVLGPVTDAELEGLYRAADVFALPSVKEGFGLAVLEALAAGLPAVVSDLDVFRTSWPTATARCWRPVGDHDALAAALVRAAREPRPRRRGCAPAGARWRRATAGTPPPRPTRRPTSASWPWRAADGLGGRGHLARRLSPPTCGRAATRSGSTSPPRGRRGQRHDADRALLRRAGELLLPGGGLRGAASATRRCPGSRSPSRPSAPGRELRYDASRRDHRGRARARAARPGWSSARGRCAGSPTRLASGVSVEYLHATTVNARFRK